jgi:hypothetical protein
MAMPTPDKTWQFNVNQFIPGTGTTDADNKTTLLAIKNSLIGFSSHPWTVSGSCNGAGSFGMDGVDRWDAISKIVFNYNGNAHSWIVLRQTGMDTLFEVLIDCYNNGSADSSRLNISWSTSGFTGGSNTQAPTALGQVFSLANNTFHGSQGFWSPWNSGYSRMLHVMMSTDGQCTRVLYINIQNPGVIGGLWLFETAKNPVSGWSPAVYVATSYYDSAWKPYYDYLKSATTGPGSMTPLTAKPFNGSLPSYPYDSRCTPATLGTGIATGTTTGTAGCMGLSFGGDGYASNLFYLARTFHNQINMQLTFGYIPLISNTAGYRGRMGTAYDMWWGPYSVLAGGYDGTWPNDSSRQFWSCGNLIVPWTGLNSPPGVVPQLYF